MKNRILAVLLLSMVLVSGCTQPSGGTTTTVVTPTTTIAQSVNIITFNLTGENFAFFLDGAKNPELRVKEGDTVRVELTVKDMMHDWKVDELSAATSVVPAGESTFVEFVASKKGTFEYYCSVGEHRANGMKGTIIVE